MSKMGGFGRRLTRQILVEHLLSIGCMLLCIEECEEWNAAGMRMDGGGAIWRLKVGCIALLVTSHQAVKGVSLTIILLRHRVLAFRFGHGVAERDACKIPYIPLLLVPCTSPLLYPAAWS